MVNKNRLLIYLIILTLVFSVLPAVSLANAEVLEVTMGVERIDASTLQLTAQSTGGTEVKYQFDMRIMDSGESYTTIREYSTEPVFTWTGADDGVIYELVVHADSEDAIYSAYYVVFGNTDSSVIIPFTGLQMEITSQENEVQINAVSQGGTNVIYALQYRIEGKEYNPLDPSNPYQASTQFTRTLEDGAYEFVVHAIDVAGGIMEYQGDYQKHTVSGQTTVVPPEDSDPLDVVVYYDQATRIEKEIGPQGGEISLTDNLNNTFILRIPEGALIAPEMVSMTSITSIDGLPMSGGLMGGVDLQPDGLQLMKSAELVFRPADPAVIDELLNPSAQYKLTGFGYYGEGEEFHLYPYTLRGDEIHFHISTFSGYGTGKANDNDRAQQQNRTPSSAQAQAAQQAADIFNNQAERERGGQDSSLTPQEEAALIEILRQWYRQSVKPLSQQAETNDAMIDCAIVEYLNWYAAILTSGIDQPLEALGAEIQQAESSLRTGINNAIDKAHQKAVANKDASQIHRMLRWELLSLQMGWKDEFDMDRIRRAARFELEFESTMGQSEIWEVSVKTDRIALELDESLGLLFWSGSGPIRHTSVWYECISNYQTVPSTFSVNSASIGLMNYQGSGCRPGGESQLPEPHVRMFIDPGHLMKTITIQCPDDDEPFTFGPTSLWHGAFSTLFYNRLDMQHGWLIDHWEMNLQELYASKQITKQFDYGVHGTIELTLWFAPLP